MFRPISEILVLVPLLYADFFEAESFTTEHRAVGAVQDVHAVSLLPFCTGGGLNYPVCRSDVEMSFSLC